MKRTALGLGLLLVGGLAACGDDGGDGDPGGGNTGGGGDSTGSSMQGIAPARYFLRIDDTLPPPVVLDLDREGALELFGESSRNIVAMEVDSTKLLENAITMIQNACGTGWMGDEGQPPIAPPNPPPMGWNPARAPRDPGYDCSGPNATPLGMSFGPNWETSPEFALVRLLTVTPANADMRDTSLEDFSSILGPTSIIVIDDAGPPPELINDFGDALAYALGIPRTSPFIPMANLIPALQQGLLATHPAISSPDGKLIPVTLYEALNNLTPLATKLGPAPGGHPGVLVPDDDGMFTTQSNVLSPAFRMRVTAESNLRWVSGIDLSNGAGDMFLSDANAPLAFDFNDPERFRIVGITENATIDMRFSVKESPETVPSCVYDDAPPVGDPACQMNYPSTPVGTDTVWTLPPFLLEPIIARGGWLQYQTRTYEQCYVPLNMMCLVGMDVGSDGNPPGWTVITSDFMSVSVPQPQFVWDLLTEVSQAVLHNPIPDWTPDTVAPEIPEGEANPEFPLYGVNIGLTSDEIIAAMRPTLQSQADEIANIILGKYWTRNDALDFYYRRPETRGATYLYFAAPTDLRPDPENPGMPKPYTYERPGFFSSPDLAPTSKVSSTQVDGVADTVHEKYRLPEGETTLYMQDDDGDIYAVRFYVPAVDSLEIVAQPARL